MFKRLRALLEPSRAVRQQLVGVQAAIETLQADRRLDAIAGLADGLRNQADTDRARLAVLEADMDAVTAERKDLILAISDGIERTDRAERRIRSTVKRAKAELVKRGYVDPGLEAEDYDLREIDGERSNESGLSAVPTEVADITPAPSSVRGVPLDTLRAARGI